MAQAEKAAMQGRSAVGSSLPSTSITSHGSARGPLLYQGSPYNHASGEVASTHTPQWRKQGGEVMPSLSPFQIFNQGLFSPT
jgi:hypothetical protein